MFPSSQARTAVALDRGTGQSPWGLPTATPEVVLFFKAGGNLTAAELTALGKQGMVPAPPSPRAHDEQDFFALLPTLTDAQRSWLRTSLAPVLPDHPWLAHRAT